MKFRLFFTILVLSLMVGCFHQALNPVPLNDVSKNHRPLFPFFAWKNDKPENTAAFQLFLSDAAGNWTGHTLSNKKPRTLLTKIGKQLFNPENSKTGTDLDESPESNSPNGLWFVKTYSIKTFADDLDNTYLIVRDIKTANTEKIKVPALSDGEMWPLFWHPQKPLFYFMVKVGEGSAQALELWEFDFIKKSYENIGDTNGHAFISPDGRWIVWETGPMLDDCHLNSSLHCVLLRAYDVEKKVNYQLTKSPSVSAFDRWNTR